MKEVGEDVTPACVVPLARKALPFAPNEGRRLRIFNEANRQISDLNFNKWNGESMREPIEFWS